MSLKATVETVFCYITYPDRTGYNTMATSVLACNEGLKTTVPGGYQERAMANMDLCLDNDAARAPAGRNMSETSDRRRWFFRSTVFKRNSPP